MLKDIVIGAGGLEIDSRADQIKYSVANGSPPLRRFFRSCVVQALSCANEPRHSLAVTRLTYYREHNRDLIILKDGHKPDALEIGNVFFFFFGIPVFVNLIVQFTIFFYSVPVFIGLNHYAFLEAFDVNLHKRLSAFVDIVLSITVNLSLLELTHVVAPLEQPEIPLEWQL